MQEFLEIMFLCTGGYNSARTASPKIPADLSARTKPSKDSSVRATSPAHSISSNNSTNTEELLLFKRSNQMKSARKPSSGTPSTMSGSSGSAGSAGKGSTNITNGNAKTLHFQPGGIKAKPLQGIKTLDSEQKRKLAAVLSRTKK